jgi:hypothetical protein
MVNVSRASIFIFIPRCFDEGGDAGKLLLVLVLLPTVVAVAVAVAVAVFLETGPLFTGDVMLFIG